MWALEVVTVGHLLETVWPLVSDRAGPGTPIKSVLSVSRPRRCQADLGGICPSRATAGAAGREAGFGKGPPATGAPGRHGCL